MAGDESQYVTLCLGAEVFAVPVSLVREILDYRESFRIPEGPDYLIGLIDVRGRGVPVIDLRRKLGLKPVEIGLATRIMVVDVPLGDRVLPLGLVADRVLEVANFSTEDRDPAPDVGVPWRSEYIEAVVRRNGSFVVIFDMARLLTASEAALLAAAA
ncbi:purine-binding chemotaxis protein CheW [Rhizomicrobium palustre]|uniref:Purine-binding chemotaxis protein CheW n=1 Tax=Rhizomicrobium palustre TaxID=189966 RepID=A0A846N2W5_9PROT|nr:chemotaxis protein CheW [Rhizomicrobium palustre]NIK89631.1 purine-binding chemotaxis protein CheW [Rhizomicrobium palustre]